MRRLAGLEVLGRKKNYGFDKCLNICHSTLNTIDKDEMLILRNLNGFRDASVHDILDISEGLLYGHAQSAVQIFAAILKKVFNKELSRVLPRRILPIATVVPGDITAIVAEDMDSIKNLLRRGRRREDDAESKLRSYLVIETNIREMEGASQSVPSLSAAVKSLKSGEWKSTLPMVAGLVQSASGGIPITLHISKHQGFPVRVDPKAPTAIAFRYVKPEDKYPYLTGELASKLGISPYTVVMLVRLFQMKGNDDYHMSIKVSRTSRVQRYSDKAYQVINNAIRKDGVQKLVLEGKKGAVLDPLLYMPESKPVESAKVLEAVRVAGT